MNEVINQSVPEALSRFMLDRCRIRADALQPLAPGELPEPARQLLAHSQDMTSTLATFHESPLQVEIHQHHRENDLYLREVFLRTLRSCEIVEYGVIAIALDQFTRAEQQAIEAGEAPLGALLHRFKISFASAPVGLFAVSSADLAHTRFAPASGTVCHGRFNRLSRTPSGEPLAWILEILPPFSR